VLLLLSQANVVRPDGQVPENNSIVGLALPKLLFPLTIPLNVIVVLELCATNLYQTSSSAAPPQELFAAMPELVAFETVPEVTLAHVLA
jgi:hypothetical protein